MDRQDRCLFEKRLKAIAEQTASAYGASAEVEWIPGPPVVCNDAEMAAFARKTAEAEGFQTVPEEQSLGGDDFSFYMEKVPGCYIKIGIGKGATIHQPTFQVRLPPAPTTRWHGMMMEMGLCPTAPPTA